ncbi:MAG: universal stress protein [Thermomicrobiales bacterium]
MKPSSPAQIERTLVPLDGSERAEAVLPFVRATSEPMAELILLEVVPKAVDVRNVFGTVIAAPDRVQEGYEEVAKKHFERALSRIDGDATSRQLVVVGDPAEEIVRVADEEHVGLIAMTSQGKGAWGPWALGSIVDRVVRQSTRPVLVVPPGNDGTAIAGMLVPTDGSKSALQALPVATELARKLKVPVRVVHSLPNDDAERPNGDNLQRQAMRRAEVQRGLQALVQQLEAAGVDASSELLTGDPVVAIISLSNPTDLIVLAKQGESGRWELGGVAANLLRAGVRPMLFVSGSTGT